MKDRTEQEILVKEAASFMRTLFQTMRDTQDVHLSDVSKMNDFTWKLARAFNLDIQGQLVDGEVHGSYYEGYVFNDDPRSYDSMEAEIAKQKEEK